MKTFKWAVFAMMVVLVVASFTDAPCKNDPQTKSFDVEKGGTLVVDVEHIGADVIIKVWNKLTVDVKVTKLSERDLEDLEISKEGNTVSVLLYADNGWRRHRSARITVNVPSDFNLDLGTSGGNVEVTGSIDGTVDASTAGGNIDVDDVDGELTLKTAGGNITAGNAGSDANLRTSGGNIRIGDVDGTLNASTAGGNITAGKIKKDLEAGTAGGNITCETVGGEASTQTAGGDIELGAVAGTASAKTAGGDIEILGATGEAVARTSGGDIKLVDISGFVKAVTAGGDIYVELDPDNTSRSNLETKGGDITLNLPADAKVTIEAKIRLRDWDRGRDDECEITSDFDAEEHDRDKRKIWARYVINGGGKLITIETVNGNIDILKR